MKIGVGQINTRVGDFEFNARKILETCNYFKIGGADFAVFPESAISGYPIKDLARYKAFVDKAQDALHKLAPMLPIPAIIGCPSRSDGPSGCRNSAYWIENGEVAASTDKHLLPNYGALNDARNFDPGEDFCAVRYRGYNIGLTICEDIWTLADDITAKRYERFASPIEYFSSAEFSGENKLDILINISASVFSSSNDNTRHKGGLLCRVSEKIGVPVLWCNLIGGNDEVIFAGGSAYVDASKKGEEKCACLKKFEEDLKIIDTDTVSSYEGGAFDFRGDEDILSALVLSLRDFVDKCGIKRVLIGLSGGIDSALVAALAVLALGKERVIGVAMPSKISSRHSVDDARSLAENLGIEFHIVPISDVVEAFERTLSPIFAGRPRDVTEENIQSRARGAILMAISNKFGALVLTTGNKSECAVGYCTLYGDTCGGFAPICDLYKTEVYRISKLINAKAGRDIIPQNTIDKAPSAELRPNQKDEDSLPPYDIFDAILKQHIDAFKSADEISGHGGLAEEVARKVARAEYKRTQYPIGPKISAVAYATDRKMPVAAKLEIL